MCTDCPFLVADPCVFGVPFRCENTCLFFFYRPRRGERLSIFSGVDPTQSKPGVSFSSPGLTHCVYRYCNGLQFTNLQLWLKELIHAFETLGRATLLVLPPTT